MLSLDELKKFPVKDYAGKNCALFLWVTDPMLPQGIDLMRACGFTYKTVAFNWVKLNKNGQKKAVEDDPFFTGLGYWTRANPELCLLGTLASKAIAVTLALCTACGTPERRWVERQRLECYAAGGDAFVYYKGEAHCARDPVILFRRFYARV